MSVTSFPFVSSNGDRKMTAKDFRTYWDSFANSGVITGCACSVSGMIVNIEDGVVNINGALGVLSGESVELVATAAQRFAIVALEFNANTEYRNIRAAVLYGSGSYPSLTKTDDVYQIPLCKAVIPASASAVTSVEDARVYSRVLYNSPVVLTEGVHYGSSLPAKAEKGMLFFVESE